MALTLVGVATVPALAAPPIHQASVGGTNDLGGISNSIAITALQTAPGGPGPNAKGEFQRIIRAPAGNIVVHADVLYMSVNIAGTEAWIGIKVTKSNNPAAVGTEWVIRVQDNGEGSNATPDRISIPAPLPASVALTQPPLPLVVNWDNGNIQVK